MTPVLELFNKILKQPPQKCFNEYLQTKLLKKISQDRRYIKDSDGKLYNFKMPNIPFKPHHIGSIV